MKKLAVLALLSLLPLAAACPVKKGYIANGVVKDIGNLAPLCEMNSTMKGMLDGARWVEVWSTSNDKKGALSIAYVIAGLKEKGWRQTAEKPTEKGKVYSFAKGGKTTVLLLGVSDPLVFVAIAGK